MGVSLGCFTRSYTLPEFDFSNKSLEQYIKFGKDTSSVNRRAVATHLLNYHKKDVQKDCDYSENVFIILNQYIVYNKLRYKDKLKIARFVHEVLFDHESCYCLNNIRITTQIRKMMLIGLIFIARKCHSNTSLKIKIFEILDKLMKNRKTIKYFINKVLSKRRSSKKVTLRISEFIFNVINRNDDRYVNVIKWCCKFISEAILIMISKEPALIKYRTSDVFYRTNDVIKEVIKLINNNLLEHEKISMTIKILIETKFKSKKKSLFDSNIEPYYDVIIKTL